YLKRSAGDTTKVGSVFNCLKLPWLWTSPRWARVPRRCCASEKTLTPMMFDPLYSSGAIHGRRRDHGKAAQVQSDAPARAGDRGGVCRPGSCGGGADELPNEHQP